MPAACACGDAAGGCGLARAAMRRPARVRRCGGWWVRWREYGLAHGETVPDRLLRNYLGWNYADAAARGARRRTGCSVGTASRRRPPTSVLSDSRKAAPSPSGRTASTSSWTAWISSSASRSFLPPALVTTISARAAVGSRRHALSEPGGLQLVDRHDHRRLVEADRSQQLGLRVLAGLGGEQHLVGAGERPSLASSAVSSVVSVYAARDSSQQRLSFNGWSPSVAGPGDPVDMRSMLPAIVRDPDDLEREDPGAVRRRAGRQRGASAERRAAIGSAGGAGRRAAIGSAGGAGRRAAIGSGGGRRQGGGRGRSVASRP